MDLLAENADRAFSGVRVACTGCDDGNRVLHRSLLHINTDFAIPFCNCVIKKCSPLANFSLPDGVAVL